MNNAPQGDIFRPVIAITLLGGLIALSICVLRPFIPAIVWATMITVATWPIMLQAQRRLWGRRALAVAVMTLALLLVFVIPLTLAIGAIVTHVPAITEWGKAIEAHADDPPPAWVHDVPFVGERLAAKWLQLTADGDLRGRISPYVSDLVAWFVRQVGGFGEVAMHFLLTVVIAAVLYAKGELARAGIIAFARRVSDDHGESSVRLAGQAIRGVAMGVVVSAFAQSLLGGLGLVIAGVPLAAVLTAIMFLLAVAQIGAVPVLACAVIWLYVKNENAWGTALLVWTVIVGCMDNVLRPFLIKRGADLPLLLIFSGVVGGLLAFGLVGLFVGPMVLAVTWKLCAAWVRRPADVAPSSLRSSVSS